MNYVDYESKEEYINADIVKIIQHIADLTKLLIWRSVQSGAGNQPCRNLASQITDEGSQGMISSFCREKISGIGINRNVFRPLTDMLLKMRESIDEIESVSDIITTEGISTWISGETATTLYLYGFSYNSNVEDDITGAFSFTIQKLNDGKGRRINYLLTNTYYHMDVCIINDITKPDDRTQIYVEHLPFFDYTDSSVEEEEPTHGK